MTGFVKKQEVGKLVRVLVAYAAWLTKVVTDVPGIFFLSIVFAVPLLLGGSVWHLRKTHALSSANRLAFCGPVAFFPYLLNQIFVLNR
jgi:hypothetical protein